MTKDAVVAEVGDANEEDLQPSSPEPKKRKCFSAPPANPPDHFRMRGNLLNTWTFATFSTSFF